MNCLLPVAQSHTFHFLMCFLILVLLLILTFYVAFNTLQVISRWVVGRAEETSTYSWSRFCTVNCRPTASNYLLSHLRSIREPNSNLRVLPLCHHGPESQYLSSHPNQYVSVQWSLVSVFLSLNY